MAELHVILRSLSYMSRDAKQRRIRVGFYITLSFSWKARIKLDVERGLIIRIISEPRFSKFATQQIIEHPLFKR